MFHLLIVEDEKRTREGLCRHIDWNGIGVDPVTAVAGGMEALLAVDDIKPDILLVPAGLFKGGGHETKRQFCHPPPQNAWKEAVL